MVPNERDNFLQVHPLRINIQIKELFSPAGSVSAQQEVRISQDDLYIVHVKGTCPMHRVRLRLGWSESAFLSYSREKRDIVPRPRTQTSGSRARFKHPESGEREKTSLIYGS